MQLGRHGLAQHKLTRSYHFEQTTQQPTWQDQMQPVSAHQEAIQELGDPAKHLHGTEDAAWRQAVTVARRMAAVSGLS